MAYAQSGGDGGSKMPWIIGGVALVYLWYEGYLASWFPSIFGTTAVATTPANSVATGSTTLTANQTAGTPTLSQIASGNSSSLLSNMVAGGAKRVLPTGLMPTHS